MSLGLNDIKRYAVVDPRIDFDEKPLNIINKSGTQILQRKIVSSNGNNSNIIYFTFANSKNVAISTKMYVKTTFNVKLSGAPNNGSSWFTNAIYGPRFMPISSCTTNATLEINGTSNTVQLSNIVDSLMRYKSNFEEISKDLSLFPSMFDYYQSYIDGAANGGGMYGTGLDSLSDIGEAGPGIQGRGGYYYSLSSDGGENDIYLNNIENINFTFTVCEPVIIPPLAWGKNIGKSLIGVSQLNLTYNLGNLQRVFCYFGTGANNLLIPTRLQVTITSPPELLLTTITPKITNKIPTKNIYPFTQVIDISQISSNLPILAEVNQKNNVPRFRIGGQEVTLSFPAQELNGVPSRIYIFAKRRNQTALTTDTYARIKSLNVTFDNQTGIFSQASPQQLYQISCENGYQGSFSDWYYYSGSVFCMNFSRDVPLQEYLAVGTAKSLLFSFDVVLQNISPIADQYDVHAVICYDGQFTIDFNGSSYLQTSILSPQDVINSKNIQKIPYRSIQTWALQGGSISSDLSNIGSSAKRFAQKAYDTYEKLPEGVRDTIYDVAENLPVVGTLVKDFGPDVSAFAKDLIGRGYSENQIYDILAASAGASIMKKKCSKDKKMKVSVPQGGKKMTKKQLMAIAS